MIPSIANIRKAIYCLNKRINLLDNLIKDMLGLDSSSILSLINILNDKDASTGILNILLLKADKSEIPAAQILSDWNESDTSDLSYIKNRPFYGSTSYSTILSETTINCNQIGPTHGGNNFSLTEDLIVGQTYKVTIDSDEYIVKAVNPLALNLNENWSVPFNDTWSIIKTTNSYTIFINGAIGQTKSIKIEKRIINAEKQIESEYVDLSKYYNKTECDNKFTPVQSNWTTSDIHDLSYIKNKPFGVETYVKSEKVYEGTATRQSSSNQVEWYVNFTSDILQIDDYIRLVINGEDRGNYTQITPNSTYGWQAVYSDTVNGYRIYSPFQEGVLSQISFRKSSIETATNLPSGDTISVEIWKCVPGETKLDNKYVDYENSVYINNIKDSIPKIWRGTQAQYDLLTPDNNTIYIIEATS